MSDFSKKDVVRILANLDQMSAGHIPEERRAWAHLFIACALLQKVKPNPEKLSREEFCKRAGQVYDTIERSVFQNPKADA